MMKKFIAAVGAGLVIAAGAVSAIAISGSTTSALDALAKFRDCFNPEIEQTNKTGFQAWQRANPDEYAQWVAFRDAVLAGQTPTPPVLTTHFGKALVCVGEMAIQEQSTTTTTTTTASTDPTGPTVSELKFPVTAGQPGTTLPERFCGDASPSSNCADAYDFNRANYAGWGDLDGLNERISWALDPLGSSKTVVRFDVYGTDSGDQYGGVRTDIYKTPRDNCDGCDGWFAFGWYFPVGFVYPDTWFVLLQNHGGSGNPPQSLELRTPPTGGTTRNYLYWKNQTEPTTGRTLFPLGPVQQGHWHYFLAQIKFRDDPTGEVRVWYSVDTLPDPTRAPTVEQTGINTLYSGYADKGRADLLLYRDYSSAAGQHQVAYACGYHRAGTAQLALTLPNCSG